MSADQARISYETFNAMAAPARAALLALGKSVEDAGLDKSLVELVKVRASQLNGCAFCVQYHLNLARRLGVASQKLDLLCVWREAGIFSAREAAALAWTEALTLMAQGLENDAAYTQLRAQFSEGEVVHLTVAIGTINQWNRIAGGLRFAPPPAVSGS